MTANQVLLGMWIKILKIFFPAVIFLIVALIYLWIDERKVENKND